MIENLAYLKKFLVPIPVWSCLGVVSLINQRAYSVEAIAHLGFGGTEI